MPTFEWKGTARNGQATGGVQVADSKDAVIAMMRRQQIVVTAVKEKGKEIALPKFGGGVSPQQIAIFTRQFSVMIDAGLPLVQCLEILGNQQENKTFKRVLIQVRQDVESGSNLADSMRKHPKVFNDLYTNMVAAGEAGGILDTILMRLATFMEKNDALVRKVKGAMIYPGVIMGVAGIAIAVLLIFVIPVFESMFASVNLALPAMTRIVIGMSDFLVGYWWAVIATAFGGVFLLKKYYATNGGKLAIDKLMLKMPVLGDVLRKSAVSRFTRTLGTLISSGVSILDGLEITAKTAGNRVISDAIMASRASIAGGDTIAQPLKDTAVFPRLLSAQETGSWVAFVVGLTLVGSFGYAGLFWACAAAVETTGADRAAVEARLAGVLSTPRFLREVAGAGESMPPKSTYFFPKVLTGMVFNPLEESWPS